MKIEFVKIQQGNSSKIITLKEFLEKIRENLELYKSPYSLLKSISSAKTSAKIISGEISTIKNKDLYRFICEEFCDFFALAFYTCENPTELERKHQEFSYKIFKKRKLQALKIKNAEALEKYPKIY